MNIQLSDHFTYRRLIRFTISTVLMLICTSMYSIVDGLFVSNYVGKMPFAGDKSDLAGIYGNRSNRIYARNRRKRHRSKNAWGR